MKRVIAIDFDGVIVDDCYPEIGGLKEDASHSLNLLSKHFTIIVWTCRSGLDLEAVRRFLDEHKLPYDYLNENTRENKRLYANDSRKVFADLYVDDRVPGGFPGWKKTIELIYSDLRNEQTTEHYRL